MENPPSLSLGGHTLNGVVESGPRGMIADILQVAGIERPAERMRLFFDVAQMCSVRLRFNEGDPRNVRLRILALGLVLAARISEQGDAGIANVVGTYDFDTEAVRLRRVRPSNPEEEHQASQANPEEENPEAEEGRRVRPRR